MLELVLTCDLGGSLTKAIVKEYPKSVSKSIVMGSAIADVGKKSVENQFENIPIESGIWVGYNKEYFVLGALAVEQFAGTNSLRKLKYEIAVPKLLGCIAAAMKEYNSTEARVYIMCLLPPSEIGDGDNLRKAIYIACKKGIESPIGKLKIEVVAFKTESEGSGIIRHRIKQLGEDWSKRNIVMTMLGYRNASAFISKNGVPKGNPTSDLGMNWLVSRFIDRSAIGLSVSDFSKVVEALVLAYQYEDKDALMRLSKKSNPKAIRTDIRIFDKNMKLLFDEYSRALFRFISDCIDECDEVLLCGGTAYFIKPYLEPFFVKEEIPLIWDGGVEVPQSIDRHNLGNRLADCYAMHETFVRGVDKLNKYERYGASVG